MRFRHSALTKAICLALYGWEPMDYVVCSTWNT